MAAQQRYSLYSLVGYVNILGILLTEVLLQTEGGHSPDVRDGVNSNLDREQQGEKNKTRPKVSSTYESSWPGNTGNKLPSLL